MISPQKVYNASAVVMAGILYVASVYGLTVVKKDERDRASERKIAYRIVDENKNGVLDHEESMFLVKKLGLINDTRTWAPEELECLLLKASTEALQNFNQTSQ